MLKRALEDPEAFWAEVAGELHWFRKWDKVFEWKYPLFKWFLGGKTNLSYNCVDYHVEKGRGNRAAIVWESPETGTSRILTYNLLLREVERCAAALKALGVGKGDTVTIYMPVIPEAAIAMLATTRIGAIHSVVFAGFGSPALAERIVDAGSKVVVTADVAYRKGKTIQLKETVDEALKTPNPVEKVIVLERGVQEPPVQKRRDLSWEEALELGKSVTADVVAMEANEPAYILYTSGTTAKPKGTVHVHGGYQVYVYAMGKWVFDMKDTETWWASSDIGWIVGHSYMIYAPLLIGCSTVMYEGVPDYPSPDAWWGVVEKHRVNKIFTAPTAVRLLMKYGEEWPRKHDLTSLKAVVSAGEVLNPAAVEWLQKKVLDDVVPVIDHMWQTESGGPMVGNPYGICMLPIKVGSATIPLPGIEGDVVDSQGKSLPPGTKGIFVCRRPFPGLTPTLWNDPDRYARDYWNKIPNCYYTGDAALRDEDGYVWFLGRDDEVMNIAAHRIGTIEVENVLVAHPAVTEAAVVGKPDPLKGEVAVAFIVLKEGEERSPRLKQELKDLVREGIGAFVVLGDILFVNMVPKTRSGKIMRRLIKAFITEGELGDYSTIEDEASLDEVRRAVEGLTEALRGAG
ncbi:MAG: acetate--CoA ligase [Thermoplasmata archaeon]